MSRSLVSLSSVLAVLLVAQGALAQRRPGGSTAFDRGVAALEAGRYNDAVGDLEEAVRVEPTPLAVYNLGLAYRGVGRSADAVAAFERYLAAPERRATPAVLTAVRQEVEGLRARLALLVVETDPADATVTVDGRPSPDVRRGVSLDAGSHQVEVSAPGRRTQRQAVALRAGARERVNVRLAAEADGAATATATPAPLSATDTWGRLIDRGVVEEGNVTAQERARREADLAARRAVRSQVRLVLYGQVGAGIGIGRDELLPGIGLGVGLRYSLSDRWDFQTRALARGHYLAQDTSTYLRWDTRLEVGVRVRPASALSPWHLGFGLSGGYSASNHTYIYIDHVLPMTRSYDYDYDTGMIGAYLETGFVFGSKEQWDIGVIASGGYPFFDAVLYFGWAVL